MPTSKYIPKERYFFTTSQSMLNIELPEVIKDKLGYFTIENEIKIYLPMTLENAAQIVKELEDGNFVLSIQLSPNQLLPVKCVSDFITEEDFNEALQYYGNYGITEFLTLNEFKNLNIKNTSQN